MSLDPDDIARRLKALPPDERLVIAVRLLAQDSPDYRELAWTIAETAVSDHAFEALQRQTKAM